jgi:RING finger protein 121
VLYFWKKRHIKSYNMVTLVGLWAFPGYLSFSMLFGRMMFVWSLFTVGTFTVMFKAYRSEVSG